LESSPGSVARDRGHQCLFILTGLVWVAFGVVVLSRPDVGAVTLALLFGVQPIAGPR